MKKLTTKQRHTKFVNQIVAGLLKLGAVERVIEWRPDAKEYVIDTIFGEYVCRPEIPSEPGYRKMKISDYWLTIFGRFSDSDRAKSLTNSVSGKWNFHYGLIIENEDSYLESMVEYFLDRLSIILPKKTIN